MQSGDRLEEGKVSETCTKAGLRAVCPGPDDCRYNNNTDCLLTPLSQDCYNPMSVIRAEDILLTDLPTPRYQLAEKLCNTKPKNCPQMEGLFSYMKNWPGGECGKVGHSFCARGKNLVSSSETTYYGYCVLKI